MLVNDDDNSITINNLLKYAASEVGTVAAVCVYSKFIPLVLEFIKKKQIRIKVATVVNFPDGNINYSKFEAEIINAINLGANEIDLVMPYRQLMMGDKLAVIRFLQLARQLSLGKTLKVIIETGHLISDSLIRLASELAIDNKVDFIKTSTGKTKIGATIDAANTILTVIKNSRTSCGLKVSGGVSSLESAMNYYHLFEQVLGLQELTPERFRIGSSGLVMQILGRL